ncbi:hypothetical protein ACQ4WX_01705 [Streptomyces lasalocidi]
MLALHSAVLLAGIPLWIVRNTHLPHGVVPLILAVNTVLVVLFQVAAARGAENLDGAVGTARKAGLVSVLACAALAAGQFTGSWGTGAIALVAVLLFTLAELWQSASGFGLGFGLAPEQARGEYLGAFHLHVVIQATLGPALVSFLVVGHNSLGWLALAAVFLTGTAAIGPAVTRARRNLAGGTAGAHGRPRAHSPAADSRLTIQPADAPAGPGCPPGAMRHPRSRPLRSRPRREEPEGHRPSAIGHRTDGVAVNKAVDDLGQAVHNVCASVTNADRRPDVSPVVASSVEPTTARTEQRAATAGPVR